MSRVKSNPGGRRVGLLTDGVLPGISTEIWNSKYRFAGGDKIAADATWDDTVWRVARAAASVEKGGKRQREKWARQFHDAIADFGFLPAGRILAGAGTERNVTLFNCFVLGTIPDDLGGIFDAVKDASLTMQAGGGIGHDFSTLRPNGARVKSIGADASGPVSFMDVWDAMCRTIQSAGQRRGAMMGTLRCDHPDIEAFIAAKSDPARLRNFNLSVLVTDAFMAAVESNSDWPLVFDGKIYKSLKARALWDQIMRATYAYAEPGVIFIDKINAANNLSYCETISATNPCGEQPLPPYGACLLGSINLAALVRDPFKSGACIDTQALETLVATAVRMLDNIIDVSRYPLKAQKQEAKSKRRIGLGITGLADALIFCGLGYGSEQGRQQAQQWMETIQNAAYRASAELAREKGAFTKFDRKAFLARPNIARLAPDVVAAISKHGVRNGCLTSIAPTGTISLVAGNVSSGIEPVFDFIYERRIASGTREAHSERVEDFAHRVYRQTHGEHAGRPATFVTAASLSPHAHLAMQAAVQPFVDSAISKTINCAEDISFDAFKDIYREAYALGLKGCTTYRPNPITGAVLVSGEAREPTPGTSDVSAQATPQSLRPDETTESHGSAPDQAAVVYMTKPLARHAALEGVTYKIKWPTSAHALYVTINDIEQDGRRRPFEIFINTKNLEHFAWTVALTRMISAVFRRGGDVAFVAEELKAVFDPEGGRWMGGRYVPSLLAAIGDVIEQHMIRIGFLSGNDFATRPPRDPQDVGDATADRAAHKLAAHAGPAAPSSNSDTRDFTPTTSPASPAPSHAHDAGPRGSGRVCPNCGRRGMQRIEGCWTCSSCNYAHCD